MLSRNDRSRYGQRPSTPLCSGCPETLLLSMIFFQLADLEIVTLKFTKLLDQLRQFTATLHLSYAGHIAVKPQDRNCGLIRPLNS